MIDILIQNVSLRNAQRVDLAITGNAFSACAPAHTITEPAQTVIDGSNYVVLPPFYNTHNHLAMSLLRGVDDELPLMDWLNRCIWPIEQRLTPEITYAGSRLAILELIKSGCVAFNDMYFYQDATARAAVELGVRGRIGLLSMAGGMERVRNDALLAMRPDLPTRIQLSYTPHAVYTTTPDILKDIARKSQELDIPVHTHASESTIEVENCLKAYGKTPIELLHACGILGSRTILAHVCHPTAHDISLLTETGTTISHCPCSNQKLASGTLPYAKLLSEGVKITVGTDGAASNNGLSMIAETKAAALSAKAQAGAPEALHLNTLYDQVTCEAADALGFTGCGRIAVGAPADCILVNLNTIPFAGGGDIVSNFIYAADTSVIDTVICDGRILMRNGIVPEENAILEDARQAARLLRLS